MCKEDGREDSDLHAKVRNPPGVLLDQHAVDDGTWSRPRDQECREPRMVAMQMVIVLVIVLMTVRMLMT